MGGRYGKYGETKRKARLRQSVRLKRKVAKIIQNKHGSRKRNRQTDRSSLKIES